MRRRPLLPPVCLTGTQKPPSIKESYLPILKDIGELVTKKNKDYGDSFAETVDKFGLNVYGIRIHDKLNRFTTLTQQEAEVKDETILDTVKDIMGYSLLMLEYIARQEQEQAD